MAQTQTSGREVVLLGAGHTHTHIVRMWRKHPLPETRLTCVSDFPLSTYSGMLPGTLAGQYEPHEMQIDLQRLCAAASVRLVCEPAAGVDRPAKTVLFKQHAPLPYDVLSVGVGSQPQLPEGATQSETVLSIKPLQTFLDRLRERIGPWRERPAGEAFRAVVVGGGAGGVEVALCLWARLRGSCPDVPVEMTIVDGNESVLAGFPRRTIRLADAELKRRGIGQRPGRIVNRIDGETLLLDDGSEMTADLVICATGAVPQPLLDEFDLPADGKGFLLTRATLQTEGDESIFAVGDCGTLREHPMPKAGVYAVRQGPVLWENIGRLQRGEPLQRWKPQKTFLRLLNTGDGRAILAYHRLSFHARWCWWLKDFIDTRFVAKYRVEE